MSTPILTNQSAFDSIYVHNFTFTWNGSQAFKNRLVIKKNSDDSIIYDSVITTFQLYHTLPLNTLINGTLYNAKLSVFDINNVESSFSNTILFYCYSSPVFYFSNIAEEQVIQNSSFLAQLFYSQTEGELLRSYQATLYDSNKSQLYTTGLVYSTNLEISLSNLSDSSQYFIRAIGQTINGMSLDTGYISFSVTYIQPALYSLLELTNVPNKGYIKITSNMISVEGTSTPNPPTYINNEKVDLSASGTNVIFDNGFTITKDFSFDLLGQDFTSYSTICELNNGSYKIEVISMIGKFDGQSVQQMYFTLNVYNSITNYRICSNPMAIPDASQQVYILIRRIGNLYDIKTTLKT